MKLTFKGGVHVEEHKNTCKCSVEKLPPPEFIYIPMRQHIGAICTPCVNKGDAVKKGTVIGIIEKGLGAPVHSSVSGTVVDMLSVNDNMGKPLLTVVIKNDYLDTVDENAIPFDKKYGKDIMSANIDEIAEAVRTAGISGMGGATFPTHAKILSAKSKAQKIIINCAECEPYITANHRLSLEEPERITNGLLLLMTSFDAQEGIIAVEDNKPDAYEALKNSVASLDDKYEKKKNIKVQLLKTKYPQGDERQLIYALTGKELATGKLPADVGCVIFNAETTAAIWSAMTLGMPLIERIVTVDGDCIERPSNLLVPLGAPFKYVLDHCGLKDGYKRIISGGPMMGNAQWDIETPVVKGTSAILALSDKTERHEPPSCIHCGKCVSVCPMRLTPSYIAQYSMIKDYDTCEFYNADCCVECGSCTYICPGNMPLLPYIRIAKGVIITKKRQAAAKAAEGSVKK